MQIMVSQTQASHHVRAHVVRESYLCACNRKFVLLHSWDGLYGGRSQKCAREFAVALFSSYGITFALTQTLLLDVYCRIKHPSCVIASSSYLPLLFQFQSTVFIRNFCHWSYIFRDIIRSLRDCGLRLDNFSQVHTTLEHNIFKWFCGAMFSCPPMTAFSLHRPRRPRPWDEREGRIQKLSQGSEIKTGLPELDI